MPVAMYHICTTYQRICKTVATWISIPGSTTTYNIMCPCLNFSVSGSFWLVDPLVTPELTVFDGLIKRVSSLGRLGRSTKEWLDEST